MGSRRGLGRCEEVGGRARGVGRGRKVEVGRDSYGLQERKGLCLDRKGWRRNTCAGGIGIYTIKPEFGYHVISLVNQLNFALRFG